MAFEALYTNIDKLVDEYVRTDKYEYIFSLIIMYETTLSIPKFKDQKAYCKRKITEVNSAYAAGYFKKK